MSTSGVTKQYIFDLVSEPNCIKGVYTTLKFLHKLVTNVPWNPTYYSVLNQELDRTLQVTSLHFIHITVS